MMDLNGTPRGHVWLQWGNWWWRIERPGLVVYRHWAGYLSAAEAGDACLVEMREREEDRETGRLAAMIVVPELYPWNGA